MGAVERPRAAVRLVAMVAQTAARMRRDSIREESRRRIVSLVFPLCRGILVTGARAASRASTYRIANSTEGGPDCGAAPGISRNRPNHGAAGSATSSTPDGTGGNSLAGGRGITLTRWILCLGNHRDIKECQSRATKEEDAGAGHFRSTSGQGTSTI